MPAVLKEWLQLIHSDIDKTRQEVEALSKMELIDKKSYEEVERILRRWHDIREYRTPVNQQTLGSLRGSAQGILDTLKNMHARETAFWKLLYRTSFSFNKHLDGLKEDAAKGDVPPQLISSLRQVIAFADTTKQQQRIVADKLRLLQILERNYDSQIKDAFMRITRGENPPSLEELMRHIDVLCDPIQNRMITQNRFVNFSEIATELKDLHGSLDKLQAEVDAVLSQP